MTETPKDLAKEADRGRSERTPWIALTGVTLVVTVVVDTPTKLDPRQEELLRELAAIRAEEKPSGNLGPGRSAGGMFGRIRDAFNGPPNRH